MTATQIIAETSFDQWHRPSSSIASEKQILETLLNRMEISDRESFLKPSLHHIPDPFLMKGMDQVSQIILDHISRDKKILIVGDYDVDGVTSSALLSRFFKLIDYTSYTCFIPSRFKHGYGLTQKSVDAIIDEKPDLIITVDSGITANEEVKRLRENNIEVIITDHHTPIEGKLPDCPLIDPKQADCNYPDDRIAGVGLVFLLLIALRTRLREQNFWQSKEPNLLEHLDLVAIGSVADQVPLIGLNRVFVVFGLIQMNKKAEHPNPGEFFNYLKILSTKAKVKFFDSKAIGFQIAPLINAAGRMGDAKDSYLFFQSPTENQAMDCYQKLESLNRKRRKKQTSMVHLATQIASEQIIEGHRGLILYHEEFHEGLLGIIASRILDEYSLPCIALTDAGNGVLKASCRSRNASILEILKECQESLLQFGGHPYAAGCTISKEQFETFKQQFYSACGKHILADQMQQFSVDIEVNLDLLTFELIDQLKCLEPHGQANRKPLFLIRGLPLPETTPLNGKHLKWKFGQDTEMIYWNGVNKIPEGEIFDIAFTFGSNQFRGETKKQITIHAITA